MPKFNKQSLVKLKECDHHLVILFEAVIKFRDCTILTGSRNQFDQDEAYANGKSKVKFPNSKHNVLPLSYAVDVAPYFADRKPADRISLIYDDVIEFGHYVLGIRDMLGMKTRIRWGGDWNGNYRSFDDENFVDGFHWEVVY